MTITLRKYIEDLEKIASEFGDNIPIKLKFIPPYVPYIAIYRDLKLKVECPKTAPKVVISVKK